MLKVKFYYVNAKYSKIFREPITKDFYYSCLEKSMRNNFPRMVSVEVEPYIYKDYYSLDSEYLVYVECERRY